MLILIFVVKATRFLLLSSLFAPIWCVGRERLRQYAMTDFPVPVALACRPGCAACCIAPSISSLNKPAGVPCSHLMADLRCALFGQPQRPACCGGLQPSVEMCGEDREEALRWLAELEAATRP